MNEAFEKIIEKLEELHERYINQYGAVGGNPMAFSVKECMEIVKQEAAAYEECYKDCGECEAYNKEKHYCPKFCKVIKETLKEIEENHNGWIPCNERLPEENKDGWTHLILSIKTGEVIFGFWHNEEMGFCKHFRDGVCRVCGVIAWMPLPEPYRSKGEQ